MPKKISFFDCLNSGFPSDFYLLITQFPCPFDKIDSCSSAIVVKWWSNHPKVSEFSFSNVLWHIFVILIVMHSPTFCCLDFKFLWDCFSLVILLCPLSLSLRDFCFHIWCFRLLDFCVFLPLPKLKQTLRFATLSFYCSRINHTRLLRSSLSLCLFTLLWQFCAFGVPGFHVGTTKAGVLESQIDTFHGPFSSLSLCLSLSHSGFLSVPCVLIFTELVIEQ